MTRFGEAAKLCRVGGICYKRWADGNGTAAKIAGAGVGKRIEAAGAGEAGSRARECFGLLSRLFSAAGAASLQADLQCLRILYVLFGLLLSRRFSTNASVDEASRGNSGGGI